MRTPIAFALLFAFLADAPPPRQQQPKPEAQLQLDEQICQGDETLLFGAMDRIGEAAAKSPRPCAKATAARAARAIAAVADADPRSFDGPGADKPVGAAGTRIKAEFSWRLKKVREARGSFAAQANALVMPAETAKPAPGHRLPGKTGETCKACHQGH